VIAVQIGKIFAKVFSAKEHLDVLFMDSQKESAVRAVFPHFMSADSYVTHVWDYTSSFATES